MNCNFQLRHYEETVKSFLDSGFVSTTLRDYFQGKNNNKKRLIMRHDVDHDINLIKNMCDIESDLGVKSSVYLRLRAKNYNLLSLSNRKLIERIRHQGHELGFHYELDDLKDDKLERELYILRSEWGAEEFVTVSPHELTRANLTGKELQWEKYGVVGEAYDKKLMSENKYISDSSCRWR